jgi:hypothetical protein
LNSAPEEAQRRAAVLRKAGSACEARVAVRRPSMVSSVDWATEWRVVERLIDCAIPVVAACSLKSLRFGSDRQLCLRQKFFDGRDSEFGRVLDQTPIESVGRDQTDHLITRTVIVYANSAN